MTANKILFPSADRAVATYTADFSLSREARGVLVYFNGTAGAGTVTSKLQYWDEVEQAWDDLTGAATAGLTGVAETDLQVYPGIATTANRAVSSGVPRKLRLSSAVSVGNYTFSAAFQELA